MSGIDEKAFSEVMGDGENSGQKAIARALLERYEAAKAPATAQPSSAATVKSPSETDPANGESMGYAESDRAAVRNEQPPLKQAPRENVGCVTKVTTLEPDQPVETPGLDPTAFVHAFKVWCFYTDEAICDRGGALKNAIQSYLGKTERESSQPVDVVLLLKKIKSHYPQVDNGTCAVCRIGYRNYLSNGNTGSCQNGSCLSHAIDAAIKAPKRESVDEWQPIETIPTEDEVTVYLKNAKGQIDTGNWYWFMDEKYTEQKLGDINSTHGFGDYTHWKPLDDQGRRGSDDK